MGKRYSNNAAMNHIANYSFGINAAAAVHSDTVDLANSGSLYIGGVGDVKIDTIEGDTVTYTAVPAGTLLPVIAARVYATGTSATAIIVNY